MKRLVLGVLGATEVRVDGVPATVRRRERDLLAALALGHPQPTALDDVIAAMWPHDPPRTARAAVQNHVSRIRKRLGDDAIETVAGAYRLGPRWTIDAEQFEERFGRARVEMSAGDPAVACGLLREALALVRNEAFGDLAESSAAVAERIRLRHLVAAGEEAFVEALLAAREVDQAISRASSLVEVEPFRETGWMLLAIALYRRGRRREALVAIARCREALREVAGLDPVAGVRRLEALILADDPTLFTCAARELLGVEPVEVEQRSEWEPFVGRDAALATCRRLLGAVAATRSGHLIEVVGPEGSGTSAFADRIALHAALDGWVVLATRCNPVPARVLEPFDELIRQLDERRAEVGRTVESPADPLVPDHDRLWGNGDGTPDAEIGRAAVDVICTTAADRPILVVVDDAHDLQPTSARLLRDLGRALGPIVVVLAGHDVPDRSSTTAAGSRTTVIELAGLGLEETALMLELHLGAPPDEQVLASIHTLTQGSPALLREVLRLETLRTQHGGLHLGNAAGHLLERAMQRLTPIARRLAEVLAVAGGPLARAVLIAAMEPDPPGDAGDGVEGVGRAERIDDVLSSRLFARVADGRVDLADGAVRRWLLDRIDDESRARLHWAVGTAILTEGGGHLAAAPHLLAAWRNDPELAIDVAARAVGVAAATQMYREAADMAAVAAGIAVDHFGPHDRRATTLMLRQADSLRAVGDRGYVALLQSVAAAAERVGDDETFAMAVAAMCAVGPLIEAGTYDEELAGLIDRALAGTLDPVTRAHLAGEATLFYSMSGRVERCIASFHVALDHARRTGDERVVLGALGNAYPALGHPDDWALRTELAAEFLSLAERLDDDDARFQALHLYFSTQVIHADPLLRTTFARQEALADELRTAARRWMVGYQRACLLYLDGRLDESEAASAETFRHAPVDRSRAITAHLVNTLAVRLAQGRAEDLHDDADRIIAEQPTLPGWRAVAAWLAALRGDHGRVIAEHDHLVREPGMPPDMSWSGAMMLLGRAVAAVGDPDRCAELIRLLAPWSGLMTWVGSCTVGPFDLALAELHLTIGDRPGGARHVARARRCVERLGAEVYAADLAALDDRLDPAA